MTTVPLQPRLPAQDHATFLVLGICGRDGHRGSHLATNRWGPIFNHQRLLVDRSQLTVKPQDGSAAPCKLFPLAAGSGNDDWCHVIFPMTNMVPNHCVEDLDMMVARWWWLHCVCSPSNVTQFTVDQMLSVATTR